MAGRDWVRAFSGHEGVVVHWHASHNVAGYLPESDDGAYAFASFDEARTALDADMNRWADGLPEGEDDEEAAEVWRQVQGLREDLAAVDPASVPDGWLGYSATNGGAHDLPTAWQVVMCNHGECAADEDVYDETGNVPSELCEAPASDYYQG
jgi:hypothetical protein